MLRTNVSSVRIPKKLNKKIIKIAQHVRPVKNAGKIRIYNVKNKQIKKEIIDSIESIFNCKISKQGLYVYSKKLELFFLTYFDYEYIRKAIEKDELIKLEKDWNNTLSVN